jgi:hypothetical protein
MRGVYEARSAVAGFRPPPCLSAPLSFMPITILDIQAQDISSTSRSHPSYSRNNQELSSIHAARVNDHFNLQASGLTPLAAYSNLTVASLHDSII